MAGKTCQICGRKSGMYPLCIKHLKMKEEGLVVKNPQTGKWELVDREEVLENSTSHDLLHEINNNAKLTQLDKEIEELESKRCIVCGEPAPYGPQCKACFYETKEFMDQLDKNARLGELNTYYYNLNGNLYRMTDFEKVKQNCNKLFAIANLTNKLHDSMTLTNKVQDDIKKVIAKKKPQEKQVISTQIKKQDSQQEKLIPTIDGHAVKSQGERIIDDILFNNRITHSYSPSVTEIDLREEPSIEADWFIPIISSNKGVYIEYWGMNTKDYNDNKERKREQYKKHDIPLIEIDKDEPFEDIRMLETRIIRELKNIAKEVFHYDYRL